MGEMFIVKIHKMIQIDEHVFEMGWSDQLVTSINCQGIIDWNSFLLVSSSSLIRNVKFPETGSVGRQHQNGGLHQKQPTKWVGKTVGIRSFVTWFIQLKELKAIETGDKQTTDVRNWMVIPAVVMSWRAKSWQNMMEMRSGGGGLKVLWPSNADYFQVITQTRHWYASSISLRWSTHKCMNWMLSRRFSICTCIS